MQWHHGNPQRTGNASLFSAGIDVKTRVTLQIRNLFLLDNASDHLYYGL